MRARPLSLAAAGVVLVALDLRIVATDVLPDVGGWLLVAAGIARLGLGWPAVAALVAALASVADVVAPHHYQAIDPITFEPVEAPRPGLAYLEHLVFDRLSSPRMVLAVLAVVAGGLALWSLLRTLDARARSAGRADGARLGLVAWLVLAVWVAPYVAVTAVQVARDGGLDPVWNGALEPVALAAIATAGAAAWSCWVNHNRAWALPTPTWSVRTA